MEKSTIDSFQEWKAGKIEGFLSKDILQLDHGSVKMVKVSPNAIYPEHQHPHKTEYAYVIEGEPMFEINGSQFIAQPGSFHVFPVNSKHKIWNPKTFECLLLIGAIEDKEM